MKIAVKSPVLCHLSIGAFRKLLVLSALCVMTSGCNSGKRNGNSEGDLPSHVFQTDGGTLYLSFELSEDDAKRENLKVEHIPFVKVEGKIYLAAVFHQITGRDFRGKRTFDMQRVYGIHDLNLESKSILLPSHKYKWDVTPVSQRVTEYILLMREAGTEKAPWKVVTIPAELHDVKVLRIPKIDEMRTLGNSSEDDIAIAKILAKGVEKVKIRMSTE